MRGDEVIVIVPRRRGGQGEQVLGLPKGHLDGEETPLQAALREVREETGAQTEPIGELGEIRYRYERRRVIVDKRVLFYLLRYRSGELKPDHEIDEVRWMPLAEATHALSYKGEREMVARAMSRLQSDR